MLINQVIAQLLLPPGGLILLTVIGLIGWKTRWGRALVALSMLSLWLLSTEPVRDLLLTPLEQAYPAFQMTPETIQGLKKDRAVIVLLGGGIHEQAREYGGRDILSSVAMMRTLYAAYLAKHTGLSVYPSGGAVLSDVSEPEGLLMQDMLIRLGLPVATIHAETTARNTWENAVNVQQMLKHRGITTVLLVTTAWHIPRSVWMFEQQGLTVIPAPCDDVVEDRDYDIRSFLPRWHYLADSVDGLHEYLGLLWYKTRY